jgi:D-3-phosphoglycerate dehydrogenase
VTVAVLTDADRFPFADADRDRLAGAGVELVEVPGHDPARVPDRADAVFAYSLRVDETLLDRLPRCRVVARCGAGYDNVDVAAARRRGIAITYVPEYGSVDVAEHTIALLLGCARRLAAADAAVRAGRWPGYPELGPMRRLGGRTLGLVGFGRIAREVARMALGLGLRVAASDPYVAAAEVRAAGVTPLGFDELLATADVVSVHLPLTAATRGLIGAAELARMKAGAVLLNTARGALVDTAALVEAVRSGRLSGAGLDVTDPEPLPAGHPLLALPQVVLTPHSAALAEEALADLRRTAVADVLLVLAGRPPRFPVPTQE